MCDFASTLLGIEKMQRKPKRTQIPYPGSSGTTPTGAMQFQQDWPGLFIRGDDAIALLGELRHVMKVAGERGVQFGPFSRLKTIVDIIEHDVTMGKSEPR